MPYIPKDKFKYYLLRPNWELRKYYNINLKELSTLEFDDFIHHLNKYMNSFRYKFGMFIFYKIPEYMEKRNRNKLFKLINSFNNKTNL